jgi:hypothetical protein
MLYTIVRTKVTLVVIILYVTTQGHITQIVGSQRFPVMVKCVSMLEIPVLRIGLKRYVSIWVTYVVKLLEVMQIHLQVHKVLKGKRAQVVLKVVLVPKVVQVEKVQPEHKARPDLLVVQALKGLLVHRVEMVLKGQ